MFSNLIKIVGLNVAKLKVIIYYIYFKINFFSQKIFIEKGQKLKQTSNRKKIEIFNPFDFRKQKKAKNTRK